MAGRVITAAAARRCGRRVTRWSSTGASQGGLHVFCAVLAWSRFRFVRFAADEKAATTLAMLAECFEVLGGVPKMVLADRMGCLKAGVVANVVVPTPDYVRFATHYGFRPDFCEAADPESKGIVENLVGYAKRDLMVPAEPDVTDLAAANEAAAAWCAEVNAAVHSEICAVPAERLEQERELLGGAAVAAARDRPEAGQPQGRQAVLRPVRVGPLLGAEPAHRHHGADHRARHQDAGDRAVHRRDRRRAPAGRAG